MTVLLDDLTRRDQEKLNHALEECGLRPLRRREEPLGVGEAGSAYAVNDQWVLKVCADFGGKSGKCLRTGDLMDKMPVNIEHIRAIIYLGYNMLIPYFIK